MRVLLLSSFLVLSAVIFAQTEQFVNLTQKTKQSYTDRGYVLVDEVSGSAQIEEPMVSELLSLEYNTYYIVLVQVDGCIYCDYDLKFVDENDFLLPVEFDFFVEDNLKQAIYKFTNDVNKKGKFVVFLDSELPYFSNIYIFKKK
ncbi:MAG TPA: hypothetical protein PLL66_07095 [Bacteroidales bacterium]|nr:hypothetical protein [Bacteroidales bacterium]